MTRKACRTTEEKPQQPAESLAHSLEYIILLLLHIVYIAYRLYGIVVVSRKELTGGTALSSPLAAAEKREQKTGNYTILYVNLLCVHVFMLPCVCGESELANNHHRKNNNNNNHKKRRWRY